MTQAPVFRAPVFRDRRPKSFPPPEFPPRKAPVFARTPPAVFPVILGLLGLGLALRRGLAALEVPGGLAEAALGALMVLWAFGWLALAVKIARRPAVLAEDLRVLPGRAGLAAATVSGMAASAVLLPYAPGVALGLALLSLALHGGLMLLIVAVLLRLPPEARGVNPGWHLIFVGFIVGAVPLAQLGWTGWASAIFWATMVAAAAIWAVSAVQLVRRIPPAPLRPMLAIHLAPAALLSTVAGLIGHDLMAQGFALYGGLILLALILGLRWIVESGFSPLWGAFAFPMAAYASALILLGGWYEMAGLVLTLAALWIVPAIAWNVLKLWPGGRLAARTNAAEA